MHDRKAHRIMRHAQAQTGTPRIDGKRTHRARTLARERRAQRRLKRTGWQTARAQAGLAA